MVGTFSFETEYSFGSSAKILNEERGISNAKSKDNRFIGKYLCCLSNHNQIPHPVKSGLDQGEKFASLSNFVIILGQHRFVPDCGVLYKYQLNRTVD